MRIMKTTFAVILGLALISFAAGSALAAPPPEGKYSGGTLKVDYPNSFDETWNATLKALNDQRLKIQSQNKSSADKTGEITAFGTGPAQAMINIRLEPAGDKTRVNIGIGQGNEMYSRELSAKISNQLGRG